MHAIVTTTHGQQEGMEGLAAMAGEEMIDWFREAEGFEGMVVLSSADTGTTHVISLWRSAEIAERHRVAREKLRDRVTAAVGVEVEGSVPYEVAFASFPER